MAKKKTNLKAFKKKVIYETKAEKADLLSSTENAVAVTGVRKVSYGVRRVSDDVRKVCDCVRKVSDGDR